MNSFQKKLTATAAGVGLVAAIGVAWAQTTQTGPDADVSNNEVKTGIQNNSNNTYKTWPQALYSDQQQQAAVTPPTQVSQAQADNTATAPAPADNSAATSAPSTSSSTDTTGGSTDNSAAPAPKADRN